MRRWPALILLAASGCSNAPLAGFLDLVHPSHVGGPAAVEDPLRNAFPPAPPPGATLQPPIQPPVTPPITPPPGPVDSGFTPPLSPRDPSPAPPPERRPPPLTVPNT